MRTIKAKIVSAYDQWANAQSDFSNIANQRIGYITGAPSIDDERKQLDAAVDRMETTIYGIIAESRTTRRYNHVCRIVDEVSGGNIPCFIADILRDERPLNRN